MTDSTHDDYLFDPAAPPDPEIARLEERLRGFRYRGDSHGAPSPASARPSALEPVRRAIGDRPTARSPARAAPWLKRLVAAVLIGAGAYMIVIHLPRGDRAAESPTKPAPADADADSVPGLRVEALNGRPQLGGLAFENGGLLRQGARLSTDGSSRARVDLASGSRSIGRIDVEPSSSLRLIRTDANEHRLALDRGEIRALTWAPPRLLFIETPSAVAVDLGCAYTLKVDDDGHGILSVTSGFVAFESGGRESLVPRGASCSTRVGRGPGTPRFDDAADDLKAALDRFDFGDGGSAAVVAVCNACSRARDTLTLFHLLPKTDGEDRRSVCSLAMKFVEPPDGATKEAIAKALRLDGDFLAAWKATLRASW